MSNDTKAPRVTFGFPFSSDPGGWWTLQSFKLYHPHLLGDCEIIVVDNSKPDCKISAEFAGHVKSNHPEVRYLRDPGPPSSCLYKERLFREATGDVVICVDAHVLLERQAIDAILTYFEARPESKDLITGVCCNAAGRIQGTNQHLKASEPYPLARDATVRHGYVCRGGQLGTWVIDPRGTDPTGEPYEIEMNGSWLLAMRREAWPGFHPFSYGFGGNEPFIYRKVQLAGGRVVTHPAVRGVHNFASAHGRGYAPLAEDKIRNYLVAAKTLGDDSLYKATVEHFSTVHSRSVGPAIQQAELVMQGKLAPRAHDTRPVAKDERPQPAPAEKPGVYEQYMEQWKQEGGDIGGACPKPLFIQLVHIKPTITDEHGTTRQTRTLEFGSGLSTIGFDRQGTVHTAIEHDRKWAGRVQRKLKPDTKVNLIHVPIVDGWYDWKPKYGELYDVILIDGPPGTIGRQGCLRYVPDMLAPGGVIYVDDTQRPAEQQISAELAERLGLATRRVQHGQRSFDILTPPPEPLGEGPGTELVAIFREMGMPACQQCHALARKMNRWGVEGCRANLQAIIDDMLPRAQRWWANSSPWMKADAWFKGHSSVWDSFKGLASGDMDKWLRWSIETHIFTAIKRFEARGDVAAADTVLQAK